MYSNESRVFATAYGVDGFHTDVILSRCGENMLCDVVLGQRRVVSVVLSKPPNKMREAILRSQGRGGMAGVQADVEHHSLTDDYGMRPLNLHSVDRV